MQLPTIVISMIRNRIRLLNYLKKKQKKKVSIIPKKHVSYIMYLDANNLYGWAMSHQKLPVNDHKWMTPEELKNIQNNIMNIDDNSDTGYSLAVDLKIPKQLHDTFNDYAPAPEHILLQYDDLSDYQKTMIDEGLGPKPSNITPKVMCALYNKTEYIVDYRLLQEYIKLGVKLQKYSKV
jgi:hypothetical protein